MLLIFLFKEMFSC